MIEIKLLSEPLQLQPCIDFVSSTNAGGINTFIGTVRNNTKGRRVLHLEFEAYRPMAIAEMQKIAEQIQQKWPAEKVAIQDLPFE